MKECWTILLSILIPICCGIYIYNFSKNCDGKVVRGLWGLECIKSEISK